MLLDTEFHQGAGLHGYTPQRELRLLSVLSHADGRLALETLWQVCSSLQRLGYPVVVLDGTAQESADAPGLAHLLAATGWPASSALDAAASQTALPVVPAALGLQRLVQQTQGAYGHGYEALRSLQPLFRAYAGVVLFAPPELAAPLLQGSPSIPLALMGPGAQGMVRAYLQLKHMALHAGLRCAVASIHPPGVKVRPRQTQEALAALQRNALQLLGMQVHTTTVWAERPQDIQRLALQLVENACTIDATLPLTATHGLTAPAAPLMDRRH